MNITGTTIITQAEATTKAASYRLEYSITDKRLVKVQASVLTLPDTQNPQGTLLGYIIFENENLHCSLPGNAPYAQLFGDFEYFLEIINETLLDESSQN